MDFALLFNLFRKPKQASVTDVTLWHKHETLLPVPLRRRRPKPIGTNLAPAERCAMGI
jgi:hypothetical protein